MSTLQNLLQSMANFSWAVSVYGLSQGAKVLRAVTSGRQAASATDSFNEATASLGSQYSPLDESVYNAGKSVTDALIGLTFNPLGVLQPGGTGASQTRPQTGQGPSQGGPRRGSEGSGGRSSPGGYDFGPTSAINYPLDMRSSYVEEVFSVFSLGQGLFDESTTHINLNLQMYDLEGRWVGVQTGVHVNITPPAELPPILVAVPPAPPLPIDTPPVPRVDVKEWTKGLFTFADGSSITAQGPAWTHLIPLTDGSFLFKVTTSQVITEGTGLFEGVRGVKEGTGTTYVAPGLVQAGKFPAPNGTFVANVIDTFRLIRRGLLDVPSVGGTGRQKPRGAGR
jgi:hypothetical protein